MNALPPGTTGPLSFALEGDGIRRAAAIFDRESVRLATALRRALPFLARRNVPIVLSWARAIPVSELLSSLTRPIFITHLMVDPGSAPGALVLDAGALSLVLDGVLGGDGRSLPPLSASGLTAPQNALIARTLEGIVLAVGEVLLARMGVRIERAEEQTEESEAGDGMSIVCAFTLGDDLGKLMLVFPKTALGVKAISETLNANDHDPRVLRALDGVDIELVVELTRLRLTLDGLLNLKVGDTLPLDVPVGATVSVRADERVLFRGTPTAVAGRIAVRIEG